MYIYKSLYEVLPYLYIVSSIVLFTMERSPWLYLSIASLYAAGALVWVTRSSYRRRNSKFQVRNRKDRFRFPEGLYEYLPFIYLGLGLLSVMHISGLTALISGGLLCLAGILVWIIRAIYRSQSGPHIQA